MAGQGPTPTQAMASGELNVAAPTAADVGAVIQQAAAAAASVAQNGTSSQGTKDAFTAFESGLEGLAEMTARAFGGPIAGDVADIAIPEIGGIIINAIKGLYDHIGAEIPTELQKLIAKI